MASTLRAIRRALKPADSDSVIVEAIPVESSHSFSAPQRDLDMLHRLASTSPIYHTSRKSVLAGIRCVTYEGNINRYWLGSILHKSSRAPFSPTWIASAYVVVRLAGRLGYRQAIDVGSGDGRIAFCAALRGMEAHSIEIDAELVDLQESATRIVEFSPHFGDAAEFDYCSLGATKTTVFVGGLAQMGGAELVGSVMRRFDCAPCAKMSTGWVFAGTTSPKYAPDPMGMHGWGSVMHGAGLRHTRTVVLPTAWTLGQDDDTPYVFAESLADVG